MKLIKLYDSLKYLLTGLLCLAVAAFLLTALREVGREQTSPDDGPDAIPNHNYIPEIEALRAEGKLSEALEMARFVVRHADMPGREEAVPLAAEIEAELDSLWGRARRVARGFVRGSGQSIEELSGGIASDMIIWGDIRDLFKQGYYHVTGNETDPVVAALAGVGLLTEAVDAADWAPAVLKAFRKIGALSRGFTDFLLSACRRSAKTRRLDGALKTAFRQLDGLVDSMGLARASAVFKHVDGPADLGAVARVAAKDADAAYFTVRNGGAGGVALLKHFGKTDAGVAAMAKAAKKGPRGIAWLKRGRAGRKHVVRTRIGVRVLKTFRLHRPQQLVTALAAEYPGMMNALRALTGLFTCVALFALVECGRKFHGARAVVRFVYR